MFLEKLLLMDIAKKFIWNAYDKPINSCVHSYMMNSDEDHDEHQHSDEEHNNILMVRMFNQNFK